jgi:phosphotransferase system HPr-like phosphotransfer protein
MNPAGNCPFKKFSQLNFLVMFKKRFFLALALAGLSFGNTANASSGWSSVFDASALSAEWSLFECTGGRSESFTNIPTANSGSYATRTWTGDNSVAWSATDARTDQTLTGKAIALRTSTLKNTTAVTGGVGTVSFRYARVFTGNSILKLFVNGVQYGGDITVSSTSSTTFSQAVNVVGSATIELRNSGNRTVIDDLSWTCYEVPVAGPELQLADVSNTNHDCGDLTINYGTHSVDVYTDAVFSIKNPGTSPLEVSALALSNTDDFAVISPTVPFTVPASGSAIVLVRFDAASAGDKTSLLTISSNDVNESRCEVSLTGTGIAPCVAPVVVEPTIVVEDVTAATANVTVGNVTADGYLAVLSAEPLTEGPADAVNYTAGDSLGGGTVAYNGTDADFALAGLAENTNYTVTVFPYNNTDCAGGPLYSTKPYIGASFTTLVAPCIGGSETFSNLGTSSSTYTTRTWTGDNGITWSATDARTDQDLTGDAIALRTGTVTNTTPVTGGIGTLSFNYKRVFTGNSTLKVFVNGVQYGGDITVSADTTTVFSQAIDVPGNVTIEIRNSGNRTIIDDISWNCYEVPDRPEIQLADSELAPKACGNFTVDFGTTALNTDKDITFTIRNQGTVALDVTALTLSDAVNYSIVSPVAPFTVDSLSSQAVVVRFNSATAGSKPGVLTIESNDADEALCTINLVANALDVCVAPSVENGAVVISNETFSSADVDVAGITATGYVAVLSTGGTVDAPTEGQIYVVGDTLASGTVAYVGTDAAFTLTGLNPETEYTLSLFAYNNAECLEGPAYSAALENIIITTAAPCVGGSETFTNVGSAASSYAVRNWTGDNGVAWTATDARTDQALTGKAITLRTGNVQNTVAVPGGIGTLSFNYRRVFSGNSTLKVFINDVQHGSDIIVSSETPAVFTQAINVAGNITIRIENSGNRTVIDDIAWDCYSANAAKGSAPTAKSITGANGQAKLYPNPSNGQFQFSLPEGNDNANVKVYNALGKLVFDKEMNENEMIDLGNAEKGIYMTVITSGSSVSTGKVIIK